MSKEIEKEVRRESRKLANEARKKLVQAVMAAKTDMLLQVLMSLEAHNGHGCANDNPEELKLVRKELVGRGISVRIKRDRFEKYINAINAMEEVVPSGQPAG